MNQKNEHKDNIIIALSVALVVAVLCCSVLGVIIGLGGDVKAGAEVAEAYYSPSSNNINLSYYYLDVDVEYDFTYGDNYSFEYTLDDLVSGMAGVDSAFLVPVVWTISLALDGYVQTDPSSTWFEFNIGTYFLGSSVFMYSSYRADSSNNFYIDIQTYGSDCYFEIEFRDSSIADDWCLYYIEEIELTYLNDERGYNAGYDEGYDIGNEEGYNLGYDDGESDGYNAGYDEGYDRGNEVGYEEGYDRGSEAGYEDGVSDGYEDGVSDGYEIGYNEGYDFGKRVGFSDGVAQAGDYTFFSLITSVFDAPLRVILGQWVDVDGDGVLDELRGGFLNFYVPVLEIDLAPLIISLFTVCIIIIVIRFVLARL